MLLNKLPCLDKGYVARVDSSNDDQKLKALALEYFKQLDGNFLSKISTLTLVIKCPLFVHIALSSYDFAITTVPPQGDIEAYVPNVGEIGAPDHNTAKAISDNIAATTEALLLNPKAYQMDGCNRFMSQVLTPINVYTTLIVHGSTDEWRRFCGQKSAPASIISYIETIRQIIKAEWKNG